MEKNRPGNGYLGHQPAPVAVLERTALCRPGESVFPPYKLVSSVRVSPSFPRAQHEAGGSWCAEVCSAVAWDAGLHLPRFLEGSFSWFSDLATHVHLCPCRRLSYRRTAGTLPSPQNSRKPPCE